MTDPSSIVPEDITFEQAIAFTQSLLTQMKQGLSEAEIERPIASLVQTQNGARGFFVVYLSDETSLADHPSTSVLQALQSSPEVVSELLTKNLAMSTAMAITHRRNQNEAMAMGSDRVRRRTTNLMRLLQLPEIAQKLEKLRESAVTGAGTYQFFLDRWHYDAEQRQAILQTIDRVIASP